MKILLQCNSVFVGVLSAEYMRECTFNPLRNLRGIIRGNCFHCEMWLVMSMDYLAVKTLKLNVVFTGV
jgi:hypothetical protein